MEDLPLLPGYRFSDVRRTNFIVPRTLSFKNGHRIIKLPRFGIGQTYKSDVHLTDDERQLLDNFQPELIYGKIRVQEPRKFIPPTVFYDKKVLRFYGYFQQTIHESPLEYYRIRRVIIYYYLEDDTVAIYEIPYKNSALNQGMRVRRHRISKNDQNEPYNWRDLNLSQNLVIYGTMYRICDCDQFTREWLESEGIELQSPEVIPPDPYSLKMIERNKNETQNDTKDVLPELSINGNRQYNRMDGKILRFYAIHDDNQDRQYGIMRKFTIHFYLIDNTIEIREIHQANNGYDPSPVYLYRQMVPKNSAYNIQSFVNLFINQREQDKICYLKPKDFVVGHHVTIFNRIFLLYDCDTFTKQFYQQNFPQLQFTSIDINPKGCAQLPTPIVSNKQDVISKPTKLMEDDNRLLRYEAIMDLLFEEDCQRRFLIVYRLVDGFISVYEKPLDGYGCSTRKFLERVRIPKPDSHPDQSSYYGPNDFYIGAHIELFKHRFIIIDADRYVYKFIEENQQDFSPHVIDSFRKNIHQTGY